MRNTHPGNEALEKPLQTVNSVSALYDHLPIAVYTCDKQGYITYFNQKAAQLWGREPEIGKDLWCGSFKIFTSAGEPMPLDDCPMAQTLKTGIACEDVEIIVERPDGKRINIVPHPLPVFNESGELTGAINTLIDITAQKSGESKEAMLVAIIKSSEDAIISKTLKGVITTWNGAAEKMYGYTEHEAIGKHITMIIPTERIDEEALIIDKISNGQNVEHFETWRKTKHGELVPVSLTISPIKDTSGKIIGASKIARDITRYKQAEEKLQRYTENLELLSEVGKSLYKSLSIDDILQKVTDVTTKLAGAAFGAFFYNKPDDHNQLCMPYLSGISREAFGKFGIPGNATLFHTIFTGDGIVSSGDITKDSGHNKNPLFHKKGEGHLPVVSYLAVPAISQTGDVIGGLFFGHPEAEKFTVEHEQLISGVVNQAAVALDNAQLYEQVQKLNAKKDEFIGLASHELKTPVTSLKGYLQIFEKGIPVADKNKAFINKALLQVNKLDGLISDLLDVSKIETGKLPLTFTRFDLKQLLKESIELLQYSFRSHSIAFDSDESAVMVKADRQRMEQVIINLVSNAIKYSANADKVVISLDKKENKASVSVEDFGLGISKEQQERIFSRFYRVEELAMHISGLGIGLYISKEIINRHKGHLGVRSELGKGSVFTFTLPLQKV